MTLPTFLTRPRAALAGATLALFTALPAAAAGPWTVTDPQGATWTAPAAGTVIVTLDTSDGYPGRDTVTQAYELVVLRTNGTTIGSTPDLADRTTSAATSAVFTVPVVAGQLLEVVHSSRIGLLDGTPNSVRVATRFDFTPTPTTTTPATPPPSTIPATTIPSSVPITAPPVPTTVAATTTTVETGPPPVSTVVVTPPRPAPAPPASATPAPVVYELPDTGRPTDRQIAVSLLPLLTGLLLALATHRRTATR